MVTLGTHDVMIFGGNEWQVAIKMSLHFARKNMKYQTIPIKSQMKSASNMSFLSKLQ